MTSLTPSQYAACADALAESVRDHQAHRQRIVDCLGITIRLADLPSWNQYVKLRDAWHCSPSRRWLRRLFAPRRHRELGRRFIDAQVQLQQDLIFKMTWEIN